MANGIIFDSAVSCMAVATVMVEDRHYVVMISKEENLWILNYCYSDGASRNDVVFMEQVDFEEHYCLKGESD